MTRCGHCPGSPKQSPLYLDHMEVLVHRVYQKKYYSETWCRCTHCGQHYKVTEDPGYHFPYQTWERIAERDVPAR